MSLTLTITTEIRPSQIVDLCDLLWGPNSPWLIATESDLDAATIAVTHLTDTPAEGATTTTITFQEILDALAALYAERQLCCAAAMITDSLGAGCADDADHVFQRAALGALIYG